MQSVVWGINAFDQWGVELSKALATGFAEQLSAAAPSEELPGIGKIIRDWRSA